MSEYNPIPKEEREMAERPAVLNAAVESELPKLDEDDWLKVRK